MGLFSRFKAATSSTTSSTNTAERTIPTPGAPRKRASSATHQLPPSNPSERARKQLQSRASSFSYTPIRKHSLTLPLPTLPTPHTLTFSSPRVKESNDAPRQSTMADDQSQQTESEMAAHGADAPMSQGVAFQLTESINSMSQQLLAFYNLSRPKIPPRQPQHSRQLYQCSRPTPKATTPNSTKSVAVSTWTLRRPCPSQQPESV